MRHEERIENARAKIDLLHREIAKRIVGHTEVIDGTLACLFSAGHVLLEGVPGLGKTLLVKTLSDALALKFSRVQFTPDLMPADIIGTQMVVQDDSGNRHFKFQPGPIFTQVLLADEINRATPKTQSALLEAMEEKHVTVGRVSHRLESPFMVLATQNPIEMEGTYPLPEAQLDRFLLKLSMKYPKPEDLSKIVERTTGVSRTKVVPIMNQDDVEEVRELVRTTVIADHVRDYAIALNMGTHPDHPYAPSLTRRYVRHGASPRGVLSMILIAKAFALFRGRQNVSFHDLKISALPALGHRILLNFEGEAQGIDTSSILHELIEQTPEVVK